jgi:stage II sporulation protein AA (anti-sigma F factor antagonist)
VPALPIPYSADVVDDGSRSLIRVSGEIDFDTGPQLRECVATAASQRLPVELDLSEVRVMDSFGLSCLIRASRDARMLGTTLTVVKTSPAVEELFRVTGTSGLFGVPPSEPMP